VFTRKEIGADGVRIQGEESEFFRMLGEEKCKFVTSGSGRGTVRCKGGGRGQERAAHTEISAGQQLRKSEGTKKRKKRKVPRHADGKPSKKEERSRPRKVSSGRMAAKRNGGE